MRYAVIAAVCLFGSGGMSFAADNRNVVAQDLCKTLSSVVTTQARGTNAVFVRSYETGTDDIKLPDGLSTSAFTYDNALAAVALVTCGDVASAALIGNALSAAVAKDRTFSDGRVRNAYRAGPVADGKIQLPGWWDSAKNLWGEDPAQNGTSSGNVAWAAIALLTLHEATNNAAYLADTERLFDWLVKNTATERGFTGGVHGYDPQQVRLMWMSTEHNVDVNAVALWLHRLTGNEKYADAAAQARRLVASAFRTDHFLLGTTSDGGFADKEAFALDAQLWPWMAIGDAPPQWRDALGFAEKQLGVDGGFDFNGDRDGVWVEGTAQAALGYRIAGQAARSDELVRGLMQDRSSSGLLNATRQSRITTGLSIDPSAGTTADFFYYKRPHLGATSWAAIAALAWNPFTGRKLN